MQQSQRWNDQDSNHLRVVVSFEKYSPHIEYRDKYEIICEHKYKLNKLELEQIMSEISEVVISPTAKMPLEAAFEEANPDINAGYNPKFWSIDKTRRYIDIELRGEMNLALYNTTSFEPIASTANHLPIVLECNRDFDIIERVKQEYQTLFKSCDKLPPCNFMEKHKRPCRLLETTNNQFIGKPEKQKLILKHLSNYDHFECFGKKKPMCQYHKNNNTCIHFENVLKNASTKEDNFDEYFQDCRHLYLYFHKRNDRSQSYNHKDSFTFFEFSLKKDDTIVGYGSNTNYCLLGLINEVIKNGFEKDLLPTDSSVDGVQLINHAINGNVKSYDPAALFSNFGSLRKQLAEKYKIFDKLQKKMNHERHKKMGCPLYEYQMLSLILYCDGECNHSLCQSQRDGTVNSKWQCFHVALHEAIDKIRKYEIHDENIYTGLAGIFLDVNQLYCTGLGNLTFNFKTYVSFTRDLRVATEFRGDEGLIIGINLYRALRGDYARACDVSWISKFPTEQEILVSAGVEFPIVPSKLKQIGKKQWIVCNYGNDDKVSFENMFLKQPLM